MYDVPKTSKGVINVQNVWVRYDNIDVLQNINLSVHTFDFLGIIGPNGGGKTTLLKTILGLVKPYKGTVNFMGDNPERKRSCMGYVPQHSKFDREFPITVWEAVLTGRLGRIGFFGRYTTQDKEVCAEMLNKVNMLSKKARQIGRLSGGEMQRVLIARALAAQPRILLFDEPTSNIDSRNQNDLYELLRELNEEIPIVLVSHDMNALSSYVNKIACLNRKLYYHNSKEITAEMLEATYQCPIDLIAHGVPHRVLKEHSGKTVGEF